MGDYDARVIMANSRDVADAWERVGERLGASVEGSEQPKLRLGIVGAVTCGSRHWDVECGAKWATTRREACGNG